MCVIPVTIQTPDGERELDVVDEARDADADEPERSRAVAERAVEQAAGELADPAGVVGPDRERGRARPDREIRVAELRRDRPRDLAAPLEVLGQALRHPPQLVVQPLGVGDVLRRTSPRCEIEMRSTETSSGLGSMPRARSRSSLPDLAAEHRAQRVVVERRQLADRSTRRPRRAAPRRAARRPAAAGSGTARGTPLRARADRRSALPACAGRRRSSRPPSSSRRPASRRGRVRVRTTALHAPRRPLARRRIAARPRRGRGIPRRCPSARPWGRSRARRTTPHASSRGRAECRGRTNVACGQRRSASAHDIAEWIPKPRAT